MTNFLHTVPDCVGTLDTVSQHACFHSRFCSLLTVTNLSKRLNLN